MRSATDNIFDFTKIQQGNEPSSKSMVVAMINVGDATVFIKMSGTIDTVSRHKQDFISLVKSVQIK
jgi:hypothetical protein